MKFLQKKIIYFILLITFSNYFYSQTPAGSLDFDGVNDYVRIPDNFQNRLRDRFTIEFWFKSNNTSQSGCYVAAKNGGSGQYGIIYEYNNNQIEFFSSGGHVGPDPRPGSSIPITDMNWHHIAYAYDGKILRGYKDGVQASISAVTFTLNALSASDWYIGAANATTGNSNIQIDEFRLWKKPLCGGEINFYKNCQLTGNESFLAACYDFNKGIAGGDNTLLTTVVSDLSINNNSGSLNNFAMIGSFSNWVTGSINSSCGTYTPTALSINSSSTSVCAGTSVTFTATSGFSNYEWNTGAVNTNTISTTPITTTVYTVTGYESNACISTASTTINVNGATVNVVAFSDTLKAISSHTPSYQWLDCSNSKSAISGATNVFYKGILNGSYALATDYNGCKDTSTCFTIQNAGSMSFDGTDDIIRLNDVPATRISNNFTIEFWIKLNAANQTNKYILTRNSSGVQWAIIYGYATNTIEFYSSSGSTGSDPRPGSGIGLNDTQWHHVAYSYDGTNLRGYLDGGIVFSTPKSFTLSPMAGTNWFIGGSGFGGSFINMKMDELRIWNRSLCTGEIVNNKNCQLTGTENGLVAYYDFNSGYVNSNNQSYNSLIDKSININNGVLSSINLTGLSSNWSDNNISGSCTSYSSPTIAILASKTFICPTETVTLSASNNSFPTYLWSNNATTSSISINPSSTSTYTLYATDASSCIASATTQIVVDSPTISVLATPTLICSGSSSSLTASNSYTTYTWNNGINTFTSNVNQISENPTLSTTYTVSATNSNNCIASATTQIVVDSPTISVLATPTLVCSGYSSSLNASSGYTTYSWNDGVNPIINTTTNGQVVVPIQTTTYTLNALNSNGCSATTTVIVSVDNPTVSIVSSPTIICSGTTGTLTASSGFINYTWLDGVNPNISTVSNTDVIAPTQTRTYTVNVINSNDCVASATTQVVVDSPTISITASPSQLCSGSNSTLTASAGYTNYAWSNSVNTNTNIVTPGITTTYSVEATNNNGCIAIDSVKISVTNIDNSTQLNGVVLSANENSASYQWIDCNNGNNPLSGEISQTYTVGVSGSYAVIINKNGCIDTSGCAPVIITGIAEKFISDMFNVFPNPSDGIITIKTILPSGISIINSLGEEVFYFHKTSVGEENIQLNELSSGIYIVIFKTNNDSYSRRLIIK